MAHAVALYSVRITKPGEPQNGVRFGSLTPYPSVTLRQALAGFHVDEDENEREISYARAISLGRKSQSAAVLIHGQRGVNSNLRRAVGRNVRRKRQDSEEVPVLVMCSMKQNRTEGVLAIHVPHGRGLKTPLTAHLMERFAVVHDKVLRINPIVPGGVLQEAVNARSVKKVRLVTSRLGPDRFGSVDGWGARDDVQSVEIAVTTKRLKYLTGPNLASYLDGNLELTDLVRFEGMSFDQVKVEVEMPNGRTRTVVLNRDDRGHPLLLDIDAFPDMYLPETAGAALTDLQKQLDQDAVQAIKDALAEASIDF